MAAAVVELGLLSPEQKHSHHIFWTRDYPLLHYVICALNGGHGRAVCTGFLFVGWWRRGKHGVADVYGKENGVFLGLVRLKED